MTALTRNYIFSPLSALLSSVDRSMTIVGYSRAAGELARMGLHEEAKTCMMEAAKLKAE
jgi:hypothetical protein